MKETPILFSSPMVRAILAGKKTMTRRLYKPRESSPYEIMGELEDGSCATWPMWTDPNQGPEYHAVRCPYGVAGDRLWVKETFAWADQMAEGIEREDPVCVAYRADHKAISHEHENVHALDTACWNWDRFKWRPSIFMPRWVSRLTLEVTAVRVERLQTIDALDAVAEGCEGSMVKGRLNGIEGEYVVGDPCEEFAALWDSINGKRADWSSNPWVWVVSFRRLVGG